MVQVKKIVSLYGECVCSILPAFHSITGCDTTSYPYNVAKVKPFKKMIKGNTSQYLSSMGMSEISYQQPEDGLKFVKQVLYPGKDNESFVETRIRMYERQKMKSSLTLLPDLSSTKEHLKRADLQAYIWYQCLSLNIKYPAPENRGWHETEDGLKPTWYFCTQLPPCLCLNSSRAKKKSGEDTDDELSDIEEEIQAISPPRKKQKQVLEHSTSQDSDTDDETVEYVEQL